MDVSGVSDNLAEGISVMGILQWGCRWSAGRCLVGMLSQGFTPYANLVFEGSSDSSKVVCVIIIIGSCLGGGGIA